MTHTTTLQEIKAEKQTRFNNLIESCCMFFAFSNEQFVENKTPLQEGEKYVSLGAGAYMPKSKVDLYLSGSKEINKWYQATIKANKVRQQHILYELNNYEAFYTNDIEDTLQALGNDYTREEVKSAFNKELRKQLL